MELDLEDPIVFGPLVLSTDHVTNAPGHAPTVTISQVGAPFRAPFGALSEVGNGYWMLAGDIRDTGIPGSLCVHATASFCDQWDGQYKVVLRADSPNVINGVLNRLGQIVTLLSDLLTRKGIN